jgi:hypothetical protein
LTKTKVESKIDALSTKLDVHIALHAAIASCLNDYGLTLYGPNHDNGLVTKVEVQSAKLKAQDGRVNLVYAILGSLGVATIGLLVWLVQNALSIASNLAGGR